MLFKLAGWLVALLFSCNCKYFYDDGYKCPSFVNSHASIV